MSLREDVIMSGSSAQLKSHSVGVIFLRSIAQLQGQHGKTAKYTSYPDVFRQIYARRGVAGLYSGIIPEYAKVIPGVAIAFCSYEVSPFLSHRNAETRPGQ